MLPNHVHLVVRYEQYQDLLWEAEKERLIEAANLSQVHEGVYSGKQPIG